MSGPRLFRWDRVSRHRQFPGTGTPGPGSVSLSVDLGDKFGGVPLRLTVQGTVTSVTIGGTPCTGLVQVGSTVTCVTPAKAVGVYTVVVSGPGGSTTITNGFESWHPTATYADARVYQADQGITFSATTASRSRAGIRCADFYGGASPLGPTDGQGSFRLDSGRLLLVCGAPMGHAVDVINTVWKSDDDGLTWSVLLPNEPGATTRFKRGHTQGYIQHAGFAYVIGGDPFATNSEVWRTPLSGDGSVWTLFSNTAPTTGLSLFMVASLAGNLYVIGGQTDMNVPGSAVSTVHRSTDNGLTWTNLGAAPWAGRSAVLGVPALGGKLYLVGGGRYDGSGGLADVYYNDVWSFDGTTWTQELANGHVQWLGRRYLSVVAMGTKLWIFNGSVAGDADTAFCMNSPTGATWTVPNFTVSWADTHAQTAIAYGNTIMFTDGFQSTQLWKIREHTGNLVTQWADQGTGALAVTQATEAKMPIRDLTAFSVQTGVAWTAGQFMALALPDRDIVTGRYECYVIGKTLNTRASGSLGPNPPATGVGSSNGSVWNCYGFSAGQLNYREQSAGTQNRLAATDIANDNSYLSGVSHGLNDIKLYLGAGVAGTPVTSCTFNTQWVGWDGLGAGFNEADGVPMSMGAAVVLRLSAPSDATFHTKLNKWSRKWDSVS